MSYTVQFTGQTQQTFTVKASASGKAHVSVTLDGITGDVMTVSSTSADGWVSDNAFWSINFDTTPTVSSNVYLENESSGGVGVPGTFAPKVAHVVSYTYAFNFGTPVTVKAGGNGVAPYQLHGRAQPAPQPQRRRRVLRPGPRGFGICFTLLVSVGLRFVQTYGDSPLGLLGDPSRRAIFELLARRPCSVGELASQLPISRPAVSQHLRVLKEGGLVVSASEGTRHVYRLNPDGVGALRTYLDRVWEDALTAFQKVAEAAPDPQEEQ